jgi:hypothetical protein
VKFSLLSFLVCVHSYKCFIATALVTSTERQGFNEACYLSAGIYLSHLIKPDPS